MTFCCVDSCNSSTKSNLAVTIDLSASFCRDSFPSLERERGNMHGFQSMEISSILQIWRIQWYRFCHNPWICRHFLLYGNVQLSWTIKMHSTSNNNSRNFDTMDFQFIFPWVSEMESVCFDNCTLPLPQT